MLTPRQERFCLNILVCNTQTEAAFLAGYAVSWAHVAASENLRKPKIRRRVEEMRKTVTKRTLEQHITELERLKSKAEAAKNTNGAIRAEELVGKASGLYIEQHRDVTDSMTDAQLIETLRDNYGLEVARTVAVKMGLPQAQQEEILGGSLQ